MTSQFADMMSLPNIFDVVLFILSSFMLISSLVLELWQFSFIRDWPEIWKSETPSEFCPISGDLDELEIPNLTRMCLIKCYWMLQNARVTAFIVPELLRENLQGWIMHVIIKFIKVTSNSKHIADRKHRKMKQ